MKRSVLALLACALACTDGRSSQPSDASEQLVADDQLDADKVDAERRRLDEPILARGQAPLGALHEVVLDPLGQAALTLDTAGGVQLWPALAAEAPDDLTTWPLNLPLQEPLWLSFAKSGDNFLLATIDTSNALQVFEVRSGSVWKLVRRFALAPSDPIFEAHVLAGGERIVALGEDHRIRLYDADGVLLSQISQPGFVPWQLRVSSHGDRVGMIAVQTRPLRVQPIVLIDDELRLDGEARTLELDRGPNRNDLELSPDGRTVAALRRERAKGREWSVELIDLASDERKLIAGRVDMQIRSRMHFVDAGRLLLESGSGHGYWVDLGKAEPLPRREDADPESRFAKRLAKRMANEHSKVPLPGAVERSKDPDDDRGLRYQSTTAAGIRAAIDDMGVLVIDPLDHPRHLELGFREAPADARLALADRSFALAECDYRDSCKLIVHELAAQLEPGKTWPAPQVWPITGRIAKFQFVREDALLLLVVGGKQEPMSVRLIAKGDGRWTETTLPLPLTGATWTSTIHPTSEASRVMLGLVTEADRQRHLFEIDLGKQTIEPRELGLDDHGNWPELLTRTELAAQTGFSEADLQQTHARVGTGLIAGRRIFTRQDAPGASPRWSATVPGDGELVQLSPDQQLAAVWVHLENPLADGRGANKLWVVLDANTGARLWSRKVAWHDWLTWNFGYADTGGSPWAGLTHDGAIELIDARTGETVEIHRGLGPAWRSAPDEQAPTRFLVDHVNEAPLTIRKLGG